MAFWDCPARYLVHSFPKAKDEIYKDFSPFAVKAAHGEVWGEEVKRMVTFHEKKDNKDRNQFAKQEWLLEDEAPAPKQCPKQEAGNT